MKPRRSVTLAIAAGFAGQGACLASASASGSKDCGDARLVIDPITSTFYLDSATRGQRLRGPPSQEMVIKPSRLVVLGTSGAVVCGSSRALFTTVARLLSRTPEGEAGEAPQSREAPVQQPHAAPPPRRDAGTTTPGPSLPVKLGLAGLVGVVVGLAGIMLRKSAQSSRKSAKNTNAARVTDVKRSPRRAASTPPPQQPPEDTDTDGRSLTPKAFEEAFGRASAKLPLPPQGSAPKSAQQFNIGTPPARVSSEMTDDSEYGGHDEPQPEMEPGQERPRLRRGIDDHLQPGKKGYVNKRKTEYDKKAETEKVEAEISRMRSKSNLDQLQRKTEFHRIMTEPDRQEDDREVTHDFEEELAPADEGAEAQGSIPAPASSSSSSQCERRRCWAGTLVEHPQLTQLSALLKSIDVGDRIIQGRLELFTCARRRLSAHQQLEVTQREPGLLQDSPLGPLASDSAQILLANLRALMALIFVNYDCSHLLPTDFERCPDKYVVVSTVNQTLAEVVDRLHAGFLGEFWQAVQDAIDITGCEIYAFRPAPGTFGPTDNSLTSFHYFFIDFHREQILFMGCVTKSRGRIRAGGDSDSDVLASADSMSSVSSKGQASSEQSSNLQEGEYAFSDDSQDDRMAD